MVDDRRGRPMNIAARIENVYHFFIARQRSDDPQFYLGKIKSREFKPGVGDEYFAHRLGVNASLRDVLHIGSRRRKPPGRRAGLAVSSVNPAIVSDMLGQ